MKNPDLTKRHLLPDEVDINLNVLGASMMNRVGGEVDLADFIAIYKCGLVNITK